MFCSGNSSESGNFRMWLELPRGHAPFSVDMGGRHSEVYQNEAIQRGATFLCKLQVDYEIVNMDD
jgi:hypothetical protein